MKAFIKTNAIPALIIIALFNLVSQQGCSSKVASKETTANSTFLMSEAEVELKTNMRKLWEDHIVWTRNVILCLVDGLPGTEQTVKRLLQNQVDIGNAFKPYYGNEAGKNLTDLLYPHIIISTDVIKAAKSGNVAALDEANKRWYENADDLAEFLSNSNPEWKLTDMKLMMYNHLKFTTEEAIHRIKKDYTSDVLAYDKVHAGVLKMADMLSEGLIRQFPEKFRTETILEASK